MRMRKGQTAMEYLMTYGWAILIIMVVLAVLFYLGVLSPQVPSQCTFPAGITCVTYKLMTNGTLRLDIGQGTGHTIEIHGVVCTQKTDLDLSTANIVYPSGLSVIISSGNKATVANETYQTICTNANLQIANGTVGDQYTNARIYINYTERDTNMNRIAVGTFSTRFEA